MNNIVITGGGTGLGAELAKLYGKAGNRVILLGRRLERLHEVAEEIHNEGGQAVCVQCNITDAEMVGAVVEELISIYGPLSVLINNAGVGHFGPLETTSIEEIEEMFNTNIKGTIYMTREILPHFKKNKAGKIMNIISTAGLRGKVNESVYVASKFAVRGFTESIQKELEHENIRVTAIYMGGMATPFWDQTDHIKDKSRLRSPQLVGRMILEQDDGRNEIIIE